MSDWKEDLKETVETSIDYSKYDLSVMIRQAEKKGACDEELYELSKLGSIEEAMEHSHAPFWCFWYALIVMKSRWQEAEPFIMKSASWSFHYSMEVLKGRWQEAEHIIAKDFYWRQQYEQRFNCDI